jgi:hypothetical protein
MTPRWPFYRCPECDWGSQHHHVTDPATGNPICPRCGCGPKRKHVVTEAIEVVPQPVPSCLSEEGTKPDRIAELEKLKKDWDSYGSEPPTAEALEKLRGFDRALAYVPVSGGGVQIEFHAFGLDFEVEIDHEGSTEDYCLERAPVASLSASSDTGGAGAWHYGAIKMGRRWHATRFHPGGPDNDGDLPDVGDTEFWEAGEWKPYGIAEFQRRATSPQQPVPDSGEAKSDDCGRCGGHGRILIEPAPGLDTKEPEYTPCTACNSTGKKQPDPPGEVLGREGVDRG